jgi:hypothetical protein
MTDVANGGSNRQPAPSMATDKPATGDINAKLLARMKQELDKPPAAVVEMRGRNPVAADDRAPRVSDYAPPDQRPDIATRALGPLPPYLTHAPNASPAARIASHAIGVQHEAAAQEAEAKGLALHDRIDAVLQDTIETARFFRERGAALFRQIETAFALADEVQQGNKAMRERIASVEHIDPPAVDEPPPSEPPMLSDELAAKVDAVVHEAKEKSGQRGV